MKVFVLMLLFMSNAATAEPLKITVTPPEYAVNEKQLYCLAQSIFFEARSEHDVGKAGTAFVMLNRVKSKHYPNTICKVIWQPYQFSWTHDGKSDDPTKYPAEQNAWHKSQFIAWMILTNRIKDPTGKADHYHANYVSPNWAKSTKQTTILGDHIFYRLY